MERFDVDADPGTDRIWDIAYSRGYDNGYDDGIKDGKTEILNDLMKVVLEWKASSYYVSCSTVMTLLESRKKYED